MKLTEEQCRIINLDTGQHLVLAPPGTGKTELLSRRLSRAVANGGDPNKMICLTFTNRAAQNMAERLDPTLGEYDIFIGNIHSFCNTYLRKNNLIPQSSSMLDEVDVELLMSEAQEGLRSYVDSDKGEVPIKVKELLSLNAYLKRVGFSFPSDIVRNPNILHWSVNDQSYAYETCKRYEEIKKVCGYIDFNDLLTMTYHHLAQQIKNTQPLYEWVQVDEAQDLNPLQWAIINKISNRNTSHRVFFGDYEQAIFSFMGAKLSILDELSKSSSVHELQNNFRSPSYLLRLYNAYAQANLEPQWQHEPKSLNKTKQESHSLVFKQIMGTQYEEVEWIVSKKLPREPKDNTAILVRNNDTADNFARALSNNGTNFFKISGFDLFHRKVVKDLMSFLNVIVNDNDKNSWSRISVLFGKIKSLKSSRGFVNSMFETGIKPIDLISHPHSNRNYLDDFLHVLQNKRIVVFDTETTGLNTREDDVIQIAAVEIVNGTIRSEFEVYIDTEKDLTESEKIHKISKQFLTEQSRPRTLALQSFLDFVGVDLLVAHNLNFDISILNSNLSRSGLSGLSVDIKLYDSIEITRRLHPKLPSYKLDYLLLELGVNGQNSHNALDDVRATANLVLALEKSIEDTREQRLDFHSNHSTQIKNLNDRFTPLYTAITGKFGEMMPISSIIDMVVSYMADQLNCVIEEEEHNEIAKLTKHMKAKCQLDDVILSINRHIPEYSKYKESDLVIGDEKIVIATIHKAKGLEFDNVIIPACTDDTYPSYFSKLDGKESMREDARLLYVGMTRAKKRLLITHHTVKAVGEREFPQKQSRFLNPIIEMLNTPI
jgi:DNA helicase-2/ATP-dependent DNA helicase PcrA